MIQVRRIDHYLWRNIHAAQPVLVADLAFDAAGWSAARAPAGLMAALRERVPVLDVADETSAPLLLARLAQALQSMGDLAQPACGAGTNADGTVTIFFAARDPFLAQTVLRAALDIVATLMAPADDARFTKLVGDCMGVLDRLRFDSSTRHLLEEAEARGIPWHRMTAATPHVQLGHGVHRRFLGEAMTSRQSAIGVAVTGNKLTTYELLGVLHVPVGRYAAVRDAASAPKLAEAIGYPVVLKPALGSKGHGVFPNLRDAGELAEALRASGANPGQLLLQSMFEGEDHRLLVVEGRLIAATMRKRAFVTGDGVHTVAELVAAENRDPRRGDGHGLMKPLVRIALDAESDRVLRQQGFTRDSVPDAGIEVRVRATGNLATGGTPVDVTAHVHPDNARVAVRAAQALDIAIAGVDFITTDISRSWRETGGGICEVNYYPDLRVNLAADPHANLAAPMLDALYPAGRGRIPTAMIVGEDAAEVAAEVGRILMAAGHTPGVANADGVFIGGEWIAKGRAVGIPGAAAVLRDPAVTAAVLQTEADVWKAGFYLDRCDVCAVLGALPAGGEALTAMADTVLTLTGDAAASAAAIAEAMRAAKP